MDLRNIQRGLIYRFAIDTFSKRKDLPIRMVHVNVLYLVFTLGKKTGTVSVGAIFSILTKIKHGCDPSFLNKILKDLEELGFVSTTRNGKRRIFGITIDGWLALGEIEKQVRICRLDRRTIKN